MQHPSRPDHSGIFLGGSQNPEHDIIHRRTIATTLTLDVKAPTAIIRILAVEEIALDLGGDGL